MSLQKEIESLINKYSREGGSDTPDFILASYMMQCLCAFESAVMRRTDWYEKHEKEKITKLEALAKRFIVDRGCTCNEANHRCGTNQMYDDLNAIRVGEQKTTL